MADKPSKRSARNKKKVEKVEKSDEQEEANFDATVAGQDTKSSKMKKKWFDSISCALFSELFLSSSQIRRVNSEKVVM